LSHIDQFGPFHGGNTGSIPTGRASKINGFAKSRNFIFNKLSISEQVFRRGGRGEEKAGQMASAKPGQWYLVVDCAGCGEPYSHCRNSFAE
jgi:hypothetical protein